MFLLALRCCALELRDRTYCPAMLAKFFVELSRGFLVSSAGVQLHLSKYSGKLFLARASLKFEPPQITWGHVHRSTVALRHSFIEV